MKILVFGGSGKMGAAAAFDLARNDAVDQVGLVGRRRDALVRVRDWLGSEKVALHSVGADDRPALQAVMKGYDVGVLTLPDRHTSYAVAHAAIEAGLDITDMLEEYHRRPDLYETEGLIMPAGMGLEQYGEWLHEKAVANGVTFLDGIGFAPGLSNITCGKAIRELDRAESAIARVGGIPAKAAAARHPLRYMITWAFWHVLREYSVRVSVRKDGRVVEVDATTDREAFRFAALGHDEMLECAVTPGMPSFIFTRPDLLEFAEKTVRWPGHWAGVETLKECGLLGLDPVEVAGVQVAPRDVLLALIEPRLRPLPGDTDVCVMYCTVTGMKDGKRMRYSYHMWDEADTAHGISSMGRVTAFPAAIAAVMIGRGAIREKGIVPPEDAIYGPAYDELIRELETRGITILETRETIE